jgi:hypothetical protein
MSRILNAWQALIVAEGATREDEIQVEGAASVETVDVYRLALRGPAVYMLVSDELDQKLRTYHLSCEEAFKAIGSDRNRLSVETRKAIRVGNRYFSADAELRVSKPKRAKGAK